MNADGPDQLREVAEQLAADDAVRVVKQIQAIPEASIPDRLLDEAKAIVVVPDTLAAVTPRAVAVTMQ